jgi:hypothetical protein
MKSTVSVGLLLLLFLGSTGLALLPSCVIVRAGDGEGDGEAEFEGEVEVEGAGEADGDDAGPTADTVVAAAADAICGALFRCCPGDDELERFFATVSGSDPAGVLGDLIPRVPPAASLAAGDCPALVAEILDRKGIGPYARAAAAAELRFDAAQARRCLDALDDASCGRPVVDALFDSTCFAFEPPLGGPDQRRMFARETTTGACHPIADGFGGIVYGTCDPTTSFCCIDRGDGTCGIGGADAVGSCVPTSAVGEPCGVVPLQWCATGHECVLGGGPDGADVCLPNLTTPLVNGEACWDADNGLALGTCSDGWCDLFGTNNCEHRLADGASCQADDQCASFGCVGGRCGVSGFCAGP